MSSKLVKRSDQETKVMKKNHQCKHTKEEKRTHMNTHGTNSALDNWDKFWEPYVKKIGKKNFHCSEFVVQGMTKICSKHYCEVLQDNLEPRTLFDAALKEACERADRYEALISKDTITHEEIKECLYCVEKHFHQELLLVLLKKFAHCVSEEDHWSLIADCWIRQEFNCSGDKRDTWRKVFNLRKSIPCLTEELPDTFTAYRAGSADGFSWTLSKEKAEWFQERFSAHYEVEIHERVFKREDALFYTNEREEEEVIIKADSLKTNCS